MTTQSSAAERLPRKALPFAAAALLLLSLPLAAQERSRPSDSSDSGRTAHDVGSRSSAPSSAPSAPSAPSTPSTSSPSPSDPPRTARPRGDNDEPHRQPPSRGDRGDRGHRGGGHGHGGFYYPYGYHGYGFWPGFWWWMGYDYPYYPYGHGQPYYYGRADGGALDLDVYPGRTEVYLDGQYIGRVDAFDGWPRYLWLPKGTYDLVLYLDGFKTIARQITVYPGMVIDVDDRMEPGESVRPESLASKSHERRDERLRDERERRERIERGERGGDDEDWRDRVRRERGAVRDDGRDEDEDDGEEIDVEEEPRQKGRLRLDVEPEDASVYLDGRFVGTGTELALMRGGLPVAPGEHRLAVVRPGRKAEERDFEVDAGEEVELEIELEESGR
jgi:PEGA domain-containing protein